MPSRREFLVGTAGLAGATLVAAPARAASAPERTWQRTYEPGDESTALVHDLVPLTSGVALVGAASRDDDYTGWIGKVDEAGRPLWHEFGGGTFSGFLAGASAAGDGRSVVAAGITNEVVSPSTPDYSDPHVARVSVNGELLWRRTYQPALPRGSASALVRVADGFVIAGSGAVEGVGRPWVARLDADGTQQWTWHHEAGGTVNAALGVDDGVLVAGSTQPVTDDETSGERQEDAWVARLAGDGRLDWEWRVGDEASARIEALAPRPDGGATAVGRRGFATEDRGVGWLVSLDSAGSRRWERTYPQSTWNWLDDVVSVGDGYLLVGTREEGVETNARGAWLLRVDAEGREEWEVQAATGTEGHTALALDDGGVLVAGERKSEDGALGAGWVAKYGGEPAQDETDDTSVSLPSLPGWVGPALAGGVVGALGASAASRRQ